ncbi:hypothetical protein C8Q74DRAFT_1217954 [Fomes fomentarius]|nr:hypothetical protein C8Q74DRAFT_1217954 [Fomes fomentarius]
MSHTLKRKADELDDSDDEEPMLGRQVLPVANLPDNFHGVPMDGLQYLFTVRRDARLLPHVKRVVNPYEVPEVPPPSTTQISGPGEEFARIGILPSEEWRETFLRRFKNFRKNSTQPTIHVHIPDSSTKLIPDKKERDLWWAFLAGRPESEWNPPRKPKQPKLSRWQQRDLQKQSITEDVSVSLPYDVGDLSYVVPETTLSESAASNNEAEVAPLDSSASAPTAASREQAAVTQTPGTIMEEPQNGSTMYSPREPTPVLLQRVDHKYAMHLLMYFGHWIDRRLAQGSLPYTDITQAHGRWIFSLLSRVDDWISSDEISQLRTLARGCMGLVAERRRSPPAAREADAAITGLWGQTDLWVDANSMLSKIEPEVS